MKKSRSSFLFIGLMTGLILILTMSASSAQSDCRDRLFGNTYACEFRAQGVTTTDGSDRILFDISYDVSMEFTDFVADDNPGNAFVGGLTQGGVLSELYCSCKTTGSFNNPQYSASQHEFVCLYGIGEAKSITVEGQVDGAGEIIDEGQLWFADPFFSPDPGNSQFIRIAFECERE